LSCNTFAAPTPTPFATKAELAAVQANIAALQNQLPAPHVIGETYGGGKVFYVDDSGQHGLIAALADQSVGIRWYNGTVRYTGTINDINDGLYAGAMNTALIVSTQISDNKNGNFAAKVAADYSVQEDGASPCTGAAAEICNGDWYLPSKAELNLLYQQKNVVGGFASNAYWSSTEKGTGINGGDYAWGQSFGNGNQDYVTKNRTLRVRAVRAF
jgi:hypothetical protein